MNQFYKKTCRIFNRQNKKQNAKDNQIKIP